jgi:hypothetical protein
MTWQPPLLQLVAAGVKTLSLDVTVYRKRLSDASTQPHRVFR